ncbi:MAG: 4-alpha-glucanotransferase [Ignavibacteria bacterium]|nr:4-alpha-glucanotransferase [Ignavibacteria bacterium]
MESNYFLNTKTAGKWHKTGTKRRAGVAVPLFSLYSSGSVGIGEIPDLKLLVDWCCITGISIIQLLPLNDVGNDFAPYSSLSTFALDPMYLKVSQIKHSDTSQYQTALQKMAKKYRPILKRINYKIKKAKIELLWEIFKSTPITGINEFGDFKAANNFWLEDYVLYKVIRELYPGTGWENWPEGLKFRDKVAIEEIRIGNIERLEFHRWMQWQLFEQMKDLKYYAAGKGVFLMGDLPFLVARESADVWSNPDLFRLNLSAGAPPDMYFALGQKWGMPPYNWDNIANNGFKYVKEKLKFAENFYDMYRMDHFVGLFRVWVSGVNNTDPSHPGSYMPPEEYLWETHGKRIIDEMISASGMLPCAEDLGTVPGCSYHVLYEYGIPGIDFQRYYKGNFAFRAPSEYRINSIAVLSTHDSSFWLNWWQFEAGTIDEKLFEMMCDKAGIEFSHCKYAKSVLFNKKLSRYGRLYWNDAVNSPQKLAEVFNRPVEAVQDIAYLYMESYGEKQKFMNYLGVNPAESMSETELMKKCIGRINSSNSIFSIQLLQEYLSIDEGLLEKMGKWDYRINSPGSVSRKNWSILLPVSLERLLELNINDDIKSIIKETQRT